MTSGWKLPSPAWPITGMAVRWRSAMASTADTSSGMRGIGHADVLDQHGAEPLDAGDGHAPRAHQQLALVGVVGDGDVGGAARPAGVGDQLRLVAAPASVRASSRAPMSGSSPIGRTARPRRSLPRSISSSAAGRTSATIRGHGPAGVLDDGEGGHDGRGRRGRRPQPEQWPR